MLQHIPLLILIRRGGADLAKDNIHTSNLHYSPVCPQVHSAGSVDPSRSTRAGDSPPQTQDSEGCRSGSAAVVVSEADTSASGSHHNAIHTDLAGCAGRMNTASHSHTEDVGRDYRGARSTQPRSQEEVGPTAMDAACTAGAGVYIADMDRTYRGTNAL